jgi:hypothetical protein
MSKINGDKARTASQIRRRNKQRAKDRPIRAAAVARAAAQPAPVTARDAPAKT